MSTAKRYGKRTFRNRTGDDKAVRVRGGHTVVKSGATTTVNDAYVDADYLEGLEAAGLSVDGKAAQTPKGDS